MTAARSHVQLCARARVTGVAFFDFNHGQTGVAPNARCSITVNYKSGPSHAAGLYPKRSTGGRVSWTWKVGTRTTPGRWSIVVSCGRAGSLHTSFVVT